MENAAADGLQYSGPYQHGKTVTETADQGAQGKDSKPYDIKTVRTDFISQFAEKEHRCRNDQHISGDNPLNLCHGNRKAAAMVGFAILTILPFRVLKYADGNDREHSPFCSITIDYLHYHIVLNRTM